VNIPAITMNDLFDRYSRDHVPTLAPRTQRDYLRHIAHLRPVFGERDPAAIKPRDVGRHLDVPTGKLHRNKQVMVLAHVFSLAIGKWFVEGVEVNPCVNVARNESKPRDRYVSDDEYLAVYRHAPLRVQMAMDLALLTGQRQGEILRLRWEHISRDGIFFQASKTRKRIMIEPSVYLGYILARAKREINRGPQRYVIETREGKPYTSDGFRGKWRRAMRMALASKTLKEKFTFHDIRAKNISDDPSLQTASDRAQHGSIGLTRSVYDRGIRRCRALYG
jgi:integrase